MEKGAKHRQIRQGRCDQSRRAKSHIFPAHTSGIIRLRSPHWSSANPSWTAFYQKIIITNCCLITSYKLFQPIRPGGIYRVATLPSSLLPHPSAPSHSPLFLAKPLRVLCRRVEFHG